MIKNQTEVSNNRSGFSLVEIMIVVMIIGLLAAFSIPAFAKARLKTQITRVVNDLKTFGEAFDMYASFNGQYPVDTHNTLPPGMEEFIKQKNWDADAFGGHYNWEGPSWGEGGSYPYAGIALFGATAPASVMQALDAECDDGDLSTGWFRLMSNGRYTYVLEE